MSVKLLFGIIELIFVKLGIAVEVRLSQMEIWYIVVLLGFKIPITLKMAAKISLVGEVLGSFPF